MPRGTHHYLQCGSKSAVRVLLLGTRGVSTFPLPTARAFPVRPTGETLGAGRQAGVNRPEGLVVQGVAKMADERFLKFFSGGIGLPRTGIGFPQIGRRSPGRNTGLPRTATLPTDRTTRFPRAAMLPTDRTTRFPRTAMLPTDRSTRFHHDGARSSHRDGSLPFRGKSAVHRDCFMYPKWKEVVRSDY